ncbi:MAG: ABC transporter permease subunit, partial [Alphaproteobacteria bacterium]|nr:ABC transporter permease subunit [Alphaproteobacteria bacterium]
MAGIRRGQRHAIDWRSVIVQALVLLALVALALWLINNVATALSHRHVASGFAFLDRTAGFGIAQSLIEYTEESSYGQAMLVGLMNTLLVSIISIVLSTIIGFIVGIGRLSTNWLVAKVCTVYVEALRNMPLLLQILFWYFGVLATLPGPRQSITLGSAVAINTRGVFVPLLMNQPGSWIVWITLAVGLVASFALYRWSQATQLRTGHRPVLWWAYPLLILGLPVAATFATGIPFTVSWPELQGFNYAGGLQII